MHYRNFMLILLTALFPLLLTAQDFNEPKQILEIMEQSKLEFQIKMGPEIVAEPVQLGDNNTPFIYAKEEEGEFIPATYAFDTLKPLFEAAEKDFATGKIVEARKAYLEIYAQRPDIAALATFIGQTYEHEGNAQEAIAWYRKAMATNFHDYMAHWFLADNLAKLKQYDEAAREIATAWVLNRNSTGIQESMVAIFKANKRKFADFDFEPNYRLRKGGSIVEILFSEDWMMYAFCKALWAYEPGYHKELGGGRPDFDMTQEKECLLNLAMGYERVNNGKRGKNIAINILMDAILAHKINEFIFVEQWLRQEPLIAYTQPKEAIVSLADYVLTIRAPKK